MRMICILDETDLLNFGDGVKELTFGKEYDILMTYWDPNRFLTNPPYSKDKIKNKVSSGKYVSLINDNGRHGDYLIDRFVTKEEWRELQLNKIGI